MIARAAESRNVRGLDNLGCRCEQIAGGRSNIRLSLFVAITSFLLPVAGAEGDSVPSPSFDQANAIPAVIVAIYGAALACFVVLWLTRKR